MDVVVAIISGITVIIVTLLKLKQNKDSPEISKIGNRLFQFQVKTENNFKTVIDTVKETRDDMKGVHAAMSTLKKEIQDIHINHAKIDVPLIKETYGKVIVLDEKSRTFERMHMLTAREIEKLKNRKSTEGKN